MLHTHLTSSLTKLSAKLLLTAAIALSLSACQSTTSDDKKSTAKQTDSALTLKSIYQDKAFKSETIGQIRWLKDGSGYLSIEDSEADKIEASESDTNRNSKNSSDSSESKEEANKEIVQYDSKTLTRTVLVTAKQLTPTGAKKALEIDDYTFSDDRSKLLIYTNSKKVWRSKSRGDYWLFDFSNNKLSQLGGKDVADSQLMFAKFSPDAKQVAFVLNNNIYVQNLNDMAISQLTNSAGNGIINGLFDWVYEEEFMIRDGFRWSPNGKKIAYWQLDTSGSKDFIMINNTDELYPTLTKFPYPKVGEDNALAKVGVVDLNSKKTTWTKLPNNSRNMYIPRMNWSGNSTEILVQHVNRKQDTNHLYLANVNSGKVKLVMTEKEESFIDFVDDARWLDKGNSFIWTSERSGWRHLYRISRDGKTITNLTNGDFDITSIKAVDEKSGWLYFIASPTNVAQRYLYRSKLDGSLSNQRVTPDEYAGFNQYQMAENGSWAIHSYSSFAEPTSKYLVSIPVTSNSVHLKKHTLMTNDKLKAKLAKLDIGQTEFFQVKAQDGLVLDGYITRPANFDASKSYPIIFYVYGEAWGQTVQNKWRGNAFMWDQMLTQQGYIVASVDNRGTRAPKGQEWRKSIYGGVGILSSRDQSDALKAMTERWSYIDSDRVGIWGHSGGGSMTLNMLFRYPEQYHVGISSAPVADQLLYDTIYQERYSGLLEDHADGYKQGSPITHAANLQGKLLLVHGTGDDNVHYQGSERLINKLVEFNKQFEFMSYPNRSHSLREGEGTTLHYKTMKTEFFKENLLEK
ncbi:S9 family peptidase [Colwellia psychrerythraea]|uniref:Dipeptidyl-peptidase IV n=1 Tax=Colwellia psychrerythraea TaxID=28229 RepID=A0A099KKD4_COLPS|nr:S9 family peptidase [Colwellia psychrerythraea]KGJ90417.1 Dipeptidyl-peptidase IV [Colwellia psychrerythraea]